METLSISTIQYKRCDLVKPEGRIDSYTAPQLEETLESIVDNGRFRIVMDLEDVNFISSKGWWVLIETQKKCKRYNRGQVVLACIDENIQDSLELIGLTEYFSLFDDVTAAVASF